MFTFMTVACNDIMELGDGLKTAFRGRSWLRKESSTEKVGEIDWNCTEVLRWYVLSCLFGGMCRGPFKYFSLSRAI